MLASKGQPEPGHEPHLDSLFAQSLGPTKINKLRSSPKAKSSKKPKATTDVISDGDSTQDIQEQALSRAVALATGSGHGWERVSRNRKRKRASAEGAVEDSYWKKLEQQDDSEEEGESKIRLSSEVIEIGGQSTVKAEDLTSAKGSRSTGPGTDHEKSQRTIFLSNVSITAIQSKTARKTLLEHLNAVVKPLPEDKPKVESIRFRSTAFAEIAAPRKAAYVRKDLMESTTKATNAYVVYSSILIAQEACKKLNGTVVLGRHLRADSVVQPAIRDHRRCVFVGNLGFVNNETTNNHGENSDGKSQSSKAGMADVEEGLWQEFDKVGTVESVRVIRDKFTRVGKGIAYVQFKESTSVERALLLNGRKFPPLLTRPLRVSRARSLPQRATHSKEVSVGDPKASAKRSERPSRPRPSNPASAKRTKRSSDYKRLKGSKFVERHHPKPTDSPPKPPKQRPEL